VRSREEKNLEGQAGAFVGNAASQNVQMGTDTAIDSMRELLYKAGKISKVGFEQSKGNLFEYIEAAKLQTNMANCGERFDRNPVTDLAAGRGGYGGHTAPDDFRMQRNGRIVGQGQAKYNNSAWRAAQNFVDPKYTDMQRIAPTDQMADIESCLHKMAENGEISKTAYENAVSNLMKKGLTDPSTGIASGGTTTAELQKLRGTDGRVSQQAVRQYAARFEGKQLAREVGTAASNMAVATGVITAIVSGTQNLFEVLQDRKTLDNALEEVKADTVSGALRGGETGVLSTDPLWRPESGTSGAFGFNRSNSHGGRADRWRRSTLFLRKRRDHRAAAAGGFGRYDGKVGRNGLFYQSARTGGRHGKSVCPDGGLYGSSLCGVLHTRYCGAGRAECGRVRSDDGIAEGINAVGTGISPSTDGFYEAI